jgi:hypothetical protein
MQAELLQQIVRRIVIVAGTEACFDIGKRGRVAGKIRFLRQIADRDSPLYEPLTGFWLYQPGSELQQS